MTATRIDRPVRAGYVKTMEAIGDYYATLRVEPGADDAALRLAYRTLMRRHHPDVSVEGDAANQCQAINEAYACLRDPSKRAAYDARRSGRRPAAPMSPRAYHPTWGAQYADRSARESARQSTGWKAASIGIAILLTIVTFALTSAVGTRSAPQSDASDPTWVTLKPAPEGQTPARR